MPKQRGMQGQRSQVSDADGRPATACVVDPEVRRQLAAYVRGQRVEHRLHLRARMVWDCLIERHSEAEVAEALRVTAKTVRKWCKRFLAEGMEGLSDQPRAGAPVQFAAEQRCEVLAIACANPEQYGCPEGSMWTLNRLTETAAAHIAGPVMSRSSVHRTLSTVDLKPHKEKMWLHSPDPEFKEKVNQVVGLYLDPPQDAVVLSVDEKTGIQALERRHESKPALPGRPGRREFEYVRHGTTSLIAAFNIKSGDVLHQLGPTRKADDLVAFMDTVADHYRDAKRIIIIWDNLNIHREGKSQRWTQFNARHGNRFEFRYTPIHASWVNQIEIFFSVLHRRCLRRRSFLSVAALEAAIARFLTRWNEVDGHPFNWTFRGYPLQSKAA